MKIYFLTPGKTFTAGFSASWEELVKLCIREGIEYVRDIRYSSDVYSARNTSLSMGLNIPFDMMVPFGGVPYDYMMWIDSDMEFNPESVLKLIEYDVDIVSGIAARGNTIAAPFGIWTETPQGQPCYANHNLKRIDEFPKTEQGLTEVDFVGFAFMCIKHGVFENMEYPWFRTTIARYMWKDFELTEDLGWCWRAKELGYKIYVAPDVRVGHNKSMTFTV